MHVVGKKYGAFPCVLLRLSCVFITFPCVRITLSCACPAFSSCSHAFLSPYPAFVLSLHHVLLRLPLLVLRFHRVSFRFQHVPLRLSCVRCVSHPTGVSAISRLAELSITQMSKHGTICGLFFSALMLCSLFYKYHKSSVDLKPKDSLT